MAHISNNGVQRSSSPSIGATIKRDVNKEEALQMEADAFAKLQKEKVCSIDYSFKSSSATNIQKVKTDKQEHDLMFFPEAEVKNRTESTLFNINVDKLTHTELEKLLLDDNLVNGKPTKLPTVPGTPVLSPSFPGQLYSQNSFPGRQWTPGITRLSTCTLPPVYQTASFPKLCGPFQNGFSSGMSPYQSSNTKYLTVPVTPQYMHFSVHPTAPLHSPGVVPVYSQSVTPEMAKVFDKIARTSEYLKCGKSSTDGELTSTSVTISSLQVSPKPSDISKFDWLDLDPLSKPKTDNVETMHIVNTDGNSSGNAFSRDPWDAVLEERPAEMKHPIAKCDLSASFPPSVRMSVGTHVARSQSLNIKSVSADQSKAPGPVSQSVSAERISPVEFPVTQENDSYNEELAAFSQEVTKLRNRFPYNNHSTNPGYILSPVLLQRDVNHESSSVKVSIEIEESPQPVTFTCDESSPVELIIMQALCWVHDDLNQVDIGNYVLKVCGQEEVLQNKHYLGSHEYIQNCRKCDTEIKLQLVTRPVMRSDLARTAEDDEDLTDLENHLYYIDKPFKETIKRHSLAELLDAYYSQVAFCLENENNQYKTVEYVIHAVKAICNALDGVETLAVTEATKKLKRAVNLPSAKSAKVAVKSQDGSAQNATTDESLNCENPVQAAVRMLTRAIYDLLQLYLTSFSYSPTSAESTSKNNRATKEASATNEHLQFTVFAAHRIPSGWVSIFEKYYLICSLTHNGTDLFKPIQSKKVGTYRNFFCHIKWDELISFPIQISQLPLESKLLLTLYGMFNQNAGNSPDPNKQRKSSERLGRVSLPLFDFTRKLMVGTKLLSLWTSSFISSASGTLSRKGNQMERIILQVDFPAPSFDVVYVAPNVKSKSAPHSLESLDKEIQEQLLSLLNREFTFGLSSKEKEFLWEKRLYCLSHEKSLPNILVSAPSWDWANVPEIYSVLQQWKPLSPENALALLDSKFSDQEVRSTAVKWMETISDDELTDYLPQFVQALKYEVYVDNSLVQFLLTRALGNIRVAHYLYWLLKDALQDPYSGVRYERILGALLSACGKGLREEFEKQSRLVQLLGVVAEKVRQASGSARQVVLQEGMEGVQSYFAKNKCRLPLNPSLVAKELNTKACSFFSSNAVPLKIAFVNADPLGEEINVMYKVGEDLRQDMLALQMIKIMDKIWLQEGLDLRMVVFKCISTGKDRGMVELVQSSETLRKIQVEYGVTGSFKDKPLAEWLRKYNPTEEDYDKASENFIYSCAGCCVATYVLGICDRHNDNIMLRSTGHMFHIDFGKFLGHAQMFGSFKRDRAPFVLTSDMAYVINGGEKPTSRFQLFVDLCCQAYNLIRKHAGVFLNLLSLMLTSGLPELNGVQDLKYVLDALQPQTTDAEATVFFTRLIESSLGSVATKFNFFIHNLAQLRFSGLPSSDEPILSFSPKTHTLKQDGRIKDVSIFTYQKRYNPDKYYIYVVRVLREGQTDPVFIFRTFYEFQELHNKLSILFPLWKLPGFPNKVVLGRTHVKDVAAKRKVELNSYIQSLMSSSADVSECDLVYTFFHPLPRDEKTEAIDGIAKSTDDIPLSPTSGKVGGEVKLSLSYRNGTLFIMVMHIRDLVTDDGTDPNPYVKTYLLPDPHKTSKRKTKTSRKTLNPTFNEMLVYSGYSVETLKQKELQLSVLSAESLQENFFLGGLTLPLKDFNLSKETVSWYKLSAVPHLC